MSRDTSPKILLDHRRAGRGIDVDGYVTVRELAPVAVDEPVSCGIPGQDHPGTEFVARVLAVDDSSVVWEVSGRCGFATDFDVRGS